MNIKEIFKKKSKENTVRENSNNDKFYDYLKNRVKYEKAAGTRKEYLLVKKILNRYSEINGVKNDI